MYPSQVIHFRTDTFTISSTTLFQIQWGDFKPSTLLHYISFEIWVLNINTETQRTIQRSSSWAINYFKPDLHIWVTEDHRSLSEAWWVRWVIRLPQGLESQIPLYLHIWVQLPARKQTKQWTGTRGGNWNNVSERKNTDENESTIPNTLKWNTTVNKWIYCNDWYCTSATFQCHPIMNLWCFCFTSL